MEPGDSAVMTSTLKQLADVLEARKDDSPDASYVASLYAGGTEKIAKKLGEEAIETIIAAQNGDRSQLVYETADLWFHSLVMLAHHGIHPDEVLAELERRSGTSGHTEKLNRNRDK